MQSTITSISNKLELEHDVLDTKKGLNDGSYILVVATSTVAHTLLSCSFIGANHTCKCNLRVVVPEFESVPDFLTTLRGAVNTGLEFPVEYIGLQCYTRCIEGTIIGEKCSTFFFSLMKLVSCNSVVQCKHQQIYDIDSTFTHLC